MRTVIFLGLNLIAMAIVQSNGIHQVNMSESSMVVYGTILVVCIVMDIVDFLVGLGKKD